MTFELRDYQAEAIAKTYERVAEGHRPIICSQCGSGKTVMAAHIAKDAMEEDRRVIWMTGREEIIRQAYRTFSDVCGIRNVGVLCAALENETPWHFYPKITLASWDTLKARWHKSETWKIPAELVIVDEAHLSLSPKMSETIMPYYQDRTVIGMTATPSRRNGRGLGSYYTRIIQVRSTQQLIDDGHLAPCEYWSGSHPDTEKLPIDPKTGEFRPQELGAAHRSGALIGDVVKHWLKRASDRHTIVFAVDIAHAVALCENFQEAGVAAEVIHSKMRRETRDRISEQFRAGAFQVLVNVGIATYGYDVPEVNCVVVARATRSIVLWHQMLGRGIRPKGGDYCIVLDHGNNWRRLGCIEDEIRWRLDAGRTAAVNTTREGDPSRNKNPEAPPTECGNCRYVFQRSRVCPKCGWEKPVRGKNVETLDGELVRVRKARGPEFSDEQREFFLMLRHYQESKRYSFGWALHQFEKKHKTLPPKAWNRMPTIPPSAQVRSWIRSRQIAFAKAQQKQKRRASA